MHYLPYNTSEYPTCALHGGRQGQVMKGLKHWVDNLLGTARTLGISWAWNIDFIQKGYRLAKRRPSSTHSSRTLSIFQLRTADAEDPCHHLENWHFVATCTRLPRACRPKNEKHWPVEQNSGKKGEMQCCLCTLLLRCLTRSFTRKTAPTRNGCTNFVSAGVVHKVKSSRKRKISTTGMDYHRTRALGPSVFGSGV